MNRRNFFKSVIASAAVATGVIAKPQSGFVPCLSTSEFIIAKRWRYPPKPILFSSTQGCWIPEYRMWSKDLWLRRKM